MDDANVKKSGDDEQWVSKIMDEHDELKYLRGKVVKNLSIMLLRTISNVSKRRKHFSFG